MTLKEMVLKGLNKADNGLYNIIKTEGFEKNFEEVTLLTFESDGTHKVESMKSIPLRERLRQRQEMGNTSNEDMSTRESNIEAQVDRFILDGNTYEVSVAKKFNQVANDQDYEDMSYMVIKLTVGVTNTDSSLLELNNPDMLKNHKHLSKREKATMENGIVVKRLGAFRYEFSITVPVQNGNGVFQDEETYNKMVDFIDQILAWTLEGVYTSNAIGVSKDTLAKHSLALSNKGRIRRYLTNKIREIQGEEVSDIDIRDEVNAKIEQIWDELGVRPLTDKRLDITLQMDKIHRSNDPNAFSSARNNVTVLRGQEGSTKIERLSYSIDRSVPYLVEQEDELAKYLLKLETAFTIWAENQARFAMGMDILPTKIPNLTNIYPNNKKVLTVLGFSEEQSEAITNQVSSLITSKLEATGQQMTTDALAKKF